MATSNTPVAVAAAQRHIGSDVATWRRLRRLTAAQVADRAGVSRHTVMRLENGDGASLENVLRVARSQPPWIHTPPMWVGCDPRRPCRTASGDASRTGSREH